MLPKLNLSIKVQKYLCQYTLYAILCTPYSALHHSVYHAVHCLFCITSSEYHAAYTQFCATSFHIPSYMFPILCHLISYTMLCIPNSIPPPTIYHAVRLLFFSSSYNMPCYSFPNAPHPIFHICAFLILQFLIPYTRLACFLPALAHSICHSVCFLFFTTSFYTPCCTCYIPHVLSL